VEPTRWDRILEQKPVPVLEHVLGELAKLFAADLATWPPRIEAFDELTGRSVAALLLETPQKPDVLVFQQAFHVTRLDLERQFEAHDDYLRNQRWLDAGLTAKDKGMVLFLSRFMAEQLLSLQEATEGRVTRSAMLEVLARTERLFLKDARQ
jgi:hypothetical protein